MRKNPYISKLDLKFLDMKFINIQNNQSSIKASNHNQSTELPSILANSQYQQFIHNNSQKHKYQPLPLSCSNRNEDDYYIKLQIDKYRKKIQKIKKQNQKIHKQIFQLYREGQGNTINDAKVKPVKKILVYQQKQNKKRHYSMKKLANLYQRIYDKQQKTDQRQNIKKMLLSNNLKKSFQQYLIKNDMRIPQFIKRLK